MLRSLGKYHTKIGSLRRIIKSFIPPALLNFRWRFRKPSVYWSAPFPTWDAAAALCSGYDSDLIYKKVESATQAVFNGEAIYERDSVLFSKIEYSWPLLAALMTVHATRKKLHVVDFGGALGSSYFQNKRFLDEISDVRWTVVEQSRFVEIGRAKFQGDILHFSESLAKASKSESIDIALFGSSLCYLPSPKEILDQVERLEIPFLIIDRTPFIDGPSDLYCAQFVKEPIYSASYPCRLFSEAKFSEMLYPRWRKIEDWYSDIQPNPKFTSKGGIYALC